MSNEELKRRIDEFLEDIQLGANFEDHYYPFIYKDDFISIFKEYFENFEIYLNESKEEK